MKIDLNLIAKYERAIAEKYGDIAIQHPRANWDEKKERKYLKEIKELSKFEKKREQEAEKIEKDGFLISKKLINKERNGNRQCSICKEYSFSGRDDVYKVKFDCCFKCYIQYVEEREERWQSGWRPQGD